MPRIALVVLAVALFSATASAAGPATAPATRPALQALTYERVGGFVGTHDTIAISPDGTITVKGRVMGEGKGRLTDQQMAELADLLVGWDQLRPAYRVPAADDMIYTIRYGEKTVRASSAAPTPPVFIHVREKIEQLAKNTVR